MEFPIKLGVKNTKGILHLNIIIEKFLSNAILYLHRLTDGSTI